MEQVWPSLGSSASWWRPGCAACCTHSPKPSAAAASLLVTCKALGLNGGRSTAGVSQWPWPKMVPLLHPFPSSYIFLKWLRALCGSMWPEKGRKDVLVPQLSLFHGILAERTGLYAPGLSSRRDIWQKCLVWSCLQLPWCNIWMQMCNIWSWRFKYTLPFLALLWSNNWENSSKFTLIYHVSNRRFLLCLVLSTLTTGPWS